MKLLKIFIKITKIYFGENKFLQNFLLVNFLGIPIGLIELLQGMEAKFCKVKVYPYCLSRYTIKSGYVIKNKISGCWIKILNMF